MKEYFCSLNICIGGHRAFWLWSIHNSFFSINFFNMYSTKPYFFIPIFKLKKIINFKYILINKLLNIEQGRNWAGIIENKRWVKFIFNVYVIYIAIYGSNQKPLLTIPTILQYSFHFFLNLTQFSLHSQIYYLYYFYQYWKNDTYLQGFFREFLVIFPDFALCYGSQCIYIEAYKFFPVWNRNNNLLDI